MANFKLDSPSYHSNVDSFYELIFQALSKLEDVKFLDKSIGPTGKMIQGYKNKFEEIDIKLREDFHEVSS